MRTKSILLASTIAPIAFDNAPGYTPNAEQMQEVREHNRQNNSGSGVITDEFAKRSKDSAAMLPYWDLTDAIVDGVEALRMAGAIYLPRFVDEEDADYQNRLKLTKLTNVYRDTVEGLASKPFEDEVTLGDDDDHKPPQDIADFIEDVDGTGNNLTMFASATFFNGINSAIDWILVDYDKPDPTIRTRADQKAKGVRPYWSHVLGRNIFNVQSKVVAGIEVLTYVKIYEPGEVDHIRVFQRLEVDGNISVTWELYEKRLEFDNQRKTYYYLIDNGIVTIGEIPMVPFMTGRRDGRAWRFFPAMRDAADLQIDLYQQESALKWIKTLGGYSMLAGNGVNPEKDASGKVKKLAVGPARVLYAPYNGQGVHGEWTFVQPDAAVMTFLAADVKSTIDQLRELGRQPLTAQSGNLTVITTAVAAGKAKSAVKAWALGLSNALENAMVLTCKWMNIADGAYDPVVKVFTQFDDFIDSKDLVLNTLNTARTDKDISQLTYWDELKRRGVLSADFDAEREQKRLLDEQPTDEGNIDSVTGMMKPPIQPGAPVVPPKPTPQTQPKPGAPTK